MTSGHDLASNLAKIGLLWDHRQLTHLLGKKCINKGIKLK